MNIKIISAGAGSGKTYRLTQELVQLLQSEMRPSGVIATTFTKRAATELQERVRIKLLQDGLHQQANELSNALIGTVHGLGVKLLQRFAFEAGMSPNLSIIADTDHQLFFNQALTMVLPQSKMDAFEKLSSRLNLGDYRSNYFDWRSQIQAICEAARANDLDLKTLSQSKVRSIDALFSLLPDPIQSSEESWYQQLRKMIGDTIQRMESNEDDTLTSEKAINELRKIRTTISKNGRLNWSDHAKLMKLKVGSKSREDIAPLHAMAKQTEQLPSFRKDLETFIGMMFDTASDALSEYKRYKKERGLVDYTDMETAVNKLLDHESVKATLSKEIDVLLVDEFQDTSPIQLSIFWKLSQIAQQSIWVGDPKQSIYGFRGADPDIMRGIIEHLGGIAPENIQKHSWRSREELVHLCNAIFCKAFVDLPESQVMLQPMRVRQGNEFQPAEPLSMGTAFHHWKISYGELGGRAPGSEWYAECIAHELAHTLQQQPTVYDKSIKRYRAMRPGDVAVLCPTNAQAGMMADALRKAGLSVSVASTGLLATAEVRLVLAALRYLLHENDSLSAAELIMMAEGEDLQEVVDHRLEYLYEKHSHNNSWAIDRKMLRLLNELRPQVADLSTSEILGLLLDRLRIPHLLITWPHPQQRLDNLAQLQALAIDYEDACHRLQTAASIGGFMIWLNELQRQGKDYQATGTGSGQVQVLTYHRSKGLEWPMVICAGLEKNLYDDPFGMEMVAESPDIQVDNLLDHRWLRYWVQPYGKQLRGTPLHDAVKGSEIQDRITAAAKAEEKRLLYVGLTRARDYLVLPAREKRATTWLNRVCNDGQEKQAALVPDGDFSPWQWKSTPITWRVRHRTFPREIETLNMPSCATAYHAEESFEEDHQAYHIDAYRDNPDSLKVSATLFATGMPPLEYPPERATAWVSKSIKAAFMGSIFQSNPERHRQIAERILQHSGLYTDLDVKSLADYTFGMRACLQAHWSLADLEVYPSMPLRTHRHGRLFQTVIDLLIWQNEEHLVVIQNSGYAGAESSVKKKACELGIWAFYTRHGLQQQFAGVKHIDFYVHFVSKGQIWKIHLEP